LPLASAIGMRLNEAAQHSWDVRVALDPHAELGADAVKVLIDHYTGGLGFLLSFLGRPTNFRSPPSSRSPTAVSPSWSTAASA